MSKKNNRIAQQQVQDSKVKKNAKIISVLFWLGSSFYLYSTDIGFSDVYSWKPFVFFILGPLFAAVIAQSKPAAPAPRIITSNLPFSTLVINLL